MSNGDVSNELRFEARTGYLYVELAVSQLKPELVEPLVARIVEKCHELRVACMLLECEVAKPYSNVEAYLTISQLAEACPVPIKVAFVDCSDINRSRLDFGRRLTASQKLQTQIFADQTTAEKWLVEVCEDAKAA